MKRLAKLVLLVVAALLLTPVGHAAPITYSAILSGANENPATGSPGTGSTLVTIDTAAHTLHVTVVFTGLTSGTTASHIHCCIAPNGNAGVATTTPTFAGFPLGVTAGTYDNVLDMTQASSWNPAFITANGGTTASAEAVLAAGLAAGNAYLNIHTTTNPGGEIRGFLAVQAQAATNIPTLSTWMLLLAGLLVATLAFVVQRKRQSGR
jgi:hypothetical protein